MVAPTLGGKIYSDAQYTSHEVSATQVGGNSGTGYIVTTFGVNTTLFALGAVVDTANASPGGNVQLYVLTANNGSNTFSNTFLGNLNVGAALAGNIVPYFAVAGAALGGLSYAAGAQIVAVTDSKANGVVTVFVDKAYTPSAQFAE